MQHERASSQCFLSFVQPALERALSWDMIERFQVGEDLIQIKKYGRSDDWYLSRTPQMANACLLRELVRQRYV